MHQQFLLCKAHFLRLQQCFAASIGNRSVEWVILRYYSGRCFHSRRINLTMFPDQDFVWPESHFQRKVWQIYSTDKSAGNHRSHRFDYPLKVLIQLGSHRVILWSDMRYNAGHRQHKVRQLRLLGKFSGRRHKYHNHCLLLSRKVEEYQPIIRQGKTMNRLVC